MDQFAKGNREVQMGEISSGELKSLSGHFNSMTKRINELILNNEKEVNEKNNFKMQALVAQLQPHFPVSYTHLYARQQIPEVRRP